jgi:hypothetical protein
MEKSLRHTCRLEKLSSKKHVPKKIKAKKKVDSPYFT